jgi:hypothetical protein
MFIVVSGSFSSAYFLSMVEGKTVDSLLVGLLVNSLPNSFHTLFIVQAFEYAIAANHEEIEVGFEFKHSDLGVDYNNIGVTSVPSTFGFDITKGSGHGKSSRETSERALNI